jgi:hypothetical protein
MPPTRRRRSLPFALSIFILIFAGSAFAQSSAPVAGSEPGSTQQPSARTLKTWREGMARVLAPKPGCFTASHPSTEWREIPCTHATETPHPSSSGPVRPTVGNGYDVVAQVTTGTGNYISASVGSFDSVTGVTSETGDNGPNSFTLQLNANTFGTPACSGAADPSQCQGWQQFYYSNTFYNGALIQYWLLNYGPTCPPGWTNGGGGDCFMNSGVVPVPAQPIENLVNLSVTGQANANLNSSIVHGQGMDQMIMSTGSNLYAVQMPANILSLSQGWISTEFGVFGDGGRTKATFNTSPPPTIVVRIGVANGTPTAPSCVNGQGTTGETNNLQFGSPPANPRKGSLPALVFTLNSTGGASQPCDAATELPAASKLVDTHDFNGDGTSDILWYNMASGQVVVWLVNGASVIAGGSPGFFVPWAIVGQRDFNGDGFADILWRNSDLSSPLDGNVLVWLLDGSYLIGTLPQLFLGLGALSPIRATGDFNGDGIGDLLVYETITGQADIWLLNGTSGVVKASVGRAPSDWQIVGSGDFNGDGFTDILWYNPTTGHAVMWLIKCTTGTSATCTIIGGGSPGSALSPWTVAGTGDFNGDGYSDILWLNGTTGQAVIWLLNGTSSIGGGSPGSAASPWTIAQTGDFNGDGYSDILWYNSTSGQLVTWLINGAGVIGGSSLGAAASPWQIQTMNAD